MDFLWPEPKKVAAKVISTRVTEQELKQIDSLADKYSLTRMSILRTLLRGALKHAK